MFPIMFGFLFVAVICGLWLLEVATRHKHVIGLIFAVPLCFSFVPLVVSLLPGQYRTAIVIGHLMFFVCFVTFLIALLSSSLAFLRRLWRLTNQRASTAEKAEIAPKPGTDFSARTSMFTGNSSKTEVTSVFEESGFSPNWRFFQRSPMPKSIGVELSTAPRLFWVVGLFGLCALLVHFFLFQNLP
jgi:hypothetical protein